MARYCVTNSEIFLGPEVLDAKNPIITLCAIDTVPYVMITGMYREVKLFMTDRHKSDCKFKK
jgi:hypothetical protein